jgi:hypothetical protein
MTHRKIWWSLAIVHGVGHSTVHPCTGCGTLNCPPLYRVWDTQPSTPVQGVGHSTVHPCRGCGTLNCPPLYRVWDTQLSTPVHTGCGTLNCPPLYRVWDTQLSTPVQGVGHSTVHPCTGCGTLNRPPRYTVHQTTSHWGQGSTNVHVYIIRLNIRDCGVVVMW